MTDKEWKQKSDDWHRGWRCGQGDESIQKMESADFAEGSRYAIEHPFGPVAVPM